MSSVAKICSIKGCDGKYYGRGYCIKHYRKWKRYSDPIGSPRQLYERHGMTGTPEWRIWAGIKDRCFNPNLKCYKDYGGRGITMCERWRNSFIAFYKDMGARPEGKTLDRENNDGNYSCGKCEECLAKGWSANCRWATYKEQNNNQRMHVGKSGQRGIRRSGDKWFVELYIGLYSSLEDAIAARDNAAKKLA